MKMQLPSPLDIRKESPCSETIEAAIRRSRDRAVEIIQRKSSKLALLVGPCSIHDVSQAIEYGERLKELSAHVEHFFLIMRVFLEKPRSLWGWKGFIYDPKLDGSNEIALGLKTARKLLISLSEKGVPCCSELLDPLAASYFSDLLTWGLIGARTSSSQPHRQMASGLAFPIGFKNSLCGDLDSAISGILFSRRPHTHLCIDENGLISAVSAQGNPYTHLVLRGGKQGPNFDPHSIAFASKTLQSNGLEPSLLVDCSHGNSGKDYRMQAEAFLSVIEQIAKGDDSIAGLMLESHLKSGRQTLGSDPTSLQYGVSITDSCLGWEETKSLILQADQMLAIKKRKAHLYTETA